MGLLTVWYLFIFVFLKTFFDFIIFCSSKQHWFPLCVVLLIPCTISLSAKFLVSRYLNWWPLLKFYRSIVTWHILPLRSVLVEAIHFVVFSLILRSLFFVAFPSLINSALTDVVVFPSIALLAADAGMVQGHSFLNISVSVLTLLLYNALKCYGMTYWAYSISLFKAVGMVKVLETLPSILTALVDSATQVFVSLISFFGDAEFCHCIRQLNSYDTVICLFKINRSWCKDLLYSEHFSFNYLIVKIWLLVETFLLS